MQRFGAEKLVEMIRYAEGSDGCRRVSMARAFGEAFHKQECNGTCDLCRLPNEDPVDYTLHAESMLRSLLRAGGEVTGNQVSICVSHPSWFYCWPNLASAHRNVARNRSQRGNVSPILCSKGLEGRGAPSFFFLCQLFCIKKI